MSPQRHAALGLFFIAIVGILGYFTLFKTDFSIGGNTQSMTIWFPGANGLRKGDAVWVAGMRWGKVDSLSYDPETDDIRRRIRVDLQLDNDVVLYGNHTISVQQSTVLGGKVVAIEPGTPDHGPDQQDEYFGALEDNVLEALGEVVSENREPLRQAIADLQDLIRRVSDGSGVLGALFNDDQLRDDVRVAVSNAKDFIESANAAMADLRAGQGTLGKLLNDDALYGQIQSLADDLNGAAQDARLLLADAREGQGVIGMLVKDEALANRVRGAVDDIAEITRGLRAGEGTIGALLADKSVFDDVKNISSALSEGKGTLGALIQEREVYEQIVTIADDLKAFSNLLANGDGALGKLLRDDEIYVELRKALVTLTGSLEEAREAAPVTGFISAFALGF